MALIKYVVFHPWKAATILVLGVLTGLAAFYVYQVNVALGVVASEEFDPQGARKAILAAPPVSTPPIDEAGAEEPVAEEIVFDVYDDGLSLIQEQYQSAADPKLRFPTSFSSHVPDNVFDSYLLLGSDASGALADVIILGLVPRDGEAPIMVSLPRDLWVWNPCQENFTRLNVGLNGCGEAATKAELMAIMVEDYTGIPIDHLARINFSGFARLVNTMGGISICVNHPTRDIKSQLDIPAGCQTANGTTALAWVRSRHTEQLRGEDWVQIAGSDFARQRRQQDVLFQLAARAARFSNPVTLVDRLSAVGQSVRLDSEWSFREAVATGWRYRNLTKDDVVRFSIEADNYRTSIGKAVLIPTRPFEEQLAEVYTAP